MNLYLGTDEGLAVFKLQEGEWRPQYVRLRTHRVTAVKRIGQVVWIGSTDGLWRSFDGGASVSPVDTGMHPCHVRALAVRPDLPETILVGLEPAIILLTRDLGETWHAAPDVPRLRDEHDWSLPYSPAAGCIRGFAFCGDRVYAAAEVGGVLRSDDAGATWRLLGGGVHPDVHDLAGHHANPDIIHAATGGGRFRSHDGGENWELIGDGYTRAVWTDAARPGVVLTGPARYAGAMGRVERSIDGGDTWMLASDGLEVPMTHMIESFVGVGSHVVACTSDGGLLMAKIGIWTWRAFDLGLPPVHAAAFSDA